MSQKIFDYFPCLSSVDQQTSQAKGTRDQELTKIKGRKVEVVSYKGEIHQQIKIAYAANARLFLLHPWMSWIFALTQSPSSPLCQNLCSFPGASFYFLVPKEVSETLKKKDACLSFWFQHWTGLKKIKNLNLNLNLTNTSTTRWLSLRCKRSREG